MNLRYFSKTIKLSPARWHRHCSLGIWKYEGLMERHCCLPEVVYVHVNLVICVAIIMMNQNTMWILHSNNL